MGTLAKNRSLLGTFEDGNQVRIGKDFDNMALILMRINEPSLAFCQCTPVSFLHPLM
jgi:hypothetical protein